MSDDRTAPELDLGAIALALHDAGWHPIPLPRGQKGPPPNGLTGGDGVDLDRDAVAALEWAGNIAVRAGPGELGIDVDAYAGGLDTLRALVAELGPLPRTVVSHSGRDDGSGIYWYRVPVGVRWIGGLPGIQIVQRTHRYAVVWPSTHPDHAGRYGWWDQSEEDAHEGVPEVEGLPALPWAWIERLTKGTLADGSSSAGIAPPSEVAAFVALHADARATRFLDMVVEHFRDRVAAGYARHDTMTHCLAWAMSEARAGDYPAAAAMTALAEAWVAAMDNPRRRATSSSSGRATEWETMLGWAVRRAQSLDAAELAAIADDHQGLAIGEEEGPSASVPSSSSPTSSPSDYFGRYGLKALSLSRAVEALGPLTMGLDGRLWRYRGGCWIEDGDRVVAQRCKALLRERCRPAHVANALAMLRCEDPTISDEQPEEWINTGNGLLDWRTGTLHPHTPDVCSTYQLAVPWTPGATCPTVDAWLAEVVEPDVVELMWEIAGMCVYGGDPFHRAVLLAGPGRNGKGTFLRLIKRLTGWRHVSSVTLQALSEDRFAVAQLFGKIANVAGDLDARAVLRSDVFKMVTGGDTLTGQHKYGQLFSFVNRATMLFAANETPGSADHSLGYTSRWVVVPFRSVVLGPGEEDKTLEPRMHAELEGVLVRAVDGLRRAMARGEYARPASVEAETEAFRRNADPLRRFVDDCLEVTGMPHHDVARAGVLEAYRSWCQGEGARPLGANRFWRALAELEPGIDTGVTASDHRGHRVGHAQTPIVKGVKAITWSSYRGPS